MSSNLINKVQMTPELTVGLPSILCVQTWERKDRLLFCLHVDLCFRLLYWITYFRVRRESEEEKRGKHLCKQSWKCNKEFQNKPASAQSSLCISDANALNLN